MEALPAHSPPSKAPPATSTLKLPLLRNAILHKTKNVIIMYYVIKLYRALYPSVVFTTESFNDAKAYAAIMHRNDPDYNYIVLTEAK